MESSERILDAILRIHEAPLTADGWSRTLPAIATVADSDIANMLVQNVASGHAEYLAGFRLCQVQLEAIGAAVGSGKLPTWTLTMPVGGVVQSSSAMADRDFARSAFYNEAIRPQGTFYGLTVKPVSALRHRILLTAGRRLGRDDFTSPDVEALQVLVPHIVTALQVSKRLGALDCHAKAASHAIDCLDTGVILVEGTGRILFANRLAEEHLSRSEALGVKEGRLLIYEQGQDRALHRTIADCAAISPRLLHSKHVIEVRRGDGRAPLRLIVTPFRPDTLEAALPLLGKAHPVAIILIADQEREHNSWKLRLRNEFGLTAAEAELALEIMKGDGRDAAAARLGISVATVRTHLLHIFGKTGVHRQAELVRLLLDRTQTCNE